MKILIAHDGSKGADAIWSDLKTAGLTASGEALVVTVAEWWLPMPRTYAMADYETPADIRQKERSATTLAQDLADRCRKSLPRWEVKSEAYVGSPAAAILQRADEWKPDLIVVGSRGHSAIARVLLGSVAHKILAHAPCSVRVARPRPADRAGKPARLVIGIDGSPGADAAARAVADRSWPVGTEVRLVTAMGELSIIDPSAIHGQPMLRPQQREEMLAEFHKCHEAVEKPLRERGLRVQSLIEDGNPRHVLLDQAEQCDADAIFVGYSGLSRFERMLLGSVSSAVASRATCPVEVVHPM
jgi:nucleotide-binding universal stress UspA family protein